jgi:hypothetical protein
VCEEYEAMTPDSPVIVTASSNNATSYRLKGESLERWVSIPEDEKDKNPVLMIEVSEEDTYIKEITAINTKNIETLTVTVQDSSGSEVRWLR